MESSKHIISKTIQVVAFKRDILIGDLINFWKNSKNYFLNYSPLQKKKHTEILQA